MGHGMLTFLLHVQVSSTVHVNEVLLLFKTALSACNAGGAIEMHRRKGLLMGKKLLGVSQADRDDFGKV